jgi:HSP20 family protein
MTKRTKDLVRRSDFGGFFPARFNDLFDAFNKLMDEGWDNKYFELQRKTSFPKVNVLETADTYEVEIALAGFNKEDVELELRENCLYIKVEKTDKCRCVDDCECNDNKNYLVREIAHRSFRRCLQFPMSIDTSKISTNFKRGVLSCTLGKEIIDKPEVVKIDIE